MKKQIKKDEFTTDTVKIMKSEYYKYQGALWHIGWTGEDFMNGLFAMLYKDRNYVIIKKSEESDSWGYIKTIIVRNSFDLMEPHLNKTQKNMIDKYKPSEIEAALNYIFEPFDSLEVGGKAHTILLDVRDAYHKQNKQNKLILFKRYFEKKSYKTIAEELTTPANKWSTNLVKTRLQAITQYLMNSINADEITYNVDYKSDTYFKDGLTHNGYKNNIVI